MEVPPFGLAGWFRAGPTPGASGPAVIVGHVDSKKGPDVFYRLNKLKPGDEILVYGKSGDVAVFVVDFLGACLEVRAAHSADLERYPQARDPLDYMRRSVRPL